ncbi:hypothetical protein FRC14_007782, partial [Serendipita sp. 396]
MSSTAPSPLKRFSAWTRGPPRSLSNSLGSVPNGLASPDFIPSASAATPKSTTLQTRQTTDMLDTRIEDPISPTEASPTHLATSDTSGAENPPPRPKRNPARKASNAGMSNESSPVNPNGSDALPTTPYSSTHPSVPNWSSLISQSKPASPVSTEKPPLITESTSRSRPRTRESSPVGDKAGAIEATFTMPSLPPMPAYPPPAPPGATKSKLQPDAMPFVPIQRKTTAPIVIKNAKGEAMDLQKLKTAVSGKIDDPTPNFVAAQPTTIRIESEDAKRRRLEEAKGKLSGISDGDVTEEHMDEIPKEMESSGHIDALTSSISSLNILDDGSSTGPKSPDLEDLW